MTAQTVVEESDDLSTVLPTEAFTDDDPVAEVSDADHTVGSDSGTGKGFAHKPRRFRRRRKTATDSDRDGSASVRLRRWAKVALRSAAAVVFVAAVTAACYESWLLAQHRQRDVAAAQAVDAATKYAVTLTSTDTETIDQNLTDVLDGATGDFRDSYLKASSRLRKALVEYRVATRGVVVDSAVKTVTKNRVEALLLVEESVTNSMSPDPHTELTTVRITMEHVNGRWLASNVTVLPE